MLNLATGQSDLPAGLKDNPTPTALSGTSPKSDIVLESVICSIEVVLDQE
jgi:hypothetical protein